MMADEKDTLLEIYEPEAVEPLMLSLFVSFINLSRISRLERETSCISREESRMVCC